MDFIMNYAPVIGALAGVLALLFAVVLAKRVTAVEPGNDRMVEIMNSIHEGAMAFLGRQYKTLVIFVVVMALVIVGAGMITGGTEGGLNPLTAVPFLIGAVCSILAGNIGMRIATKANARTANAAQASGLNKALSVAFSGGAVMGMSVVGLGLLGLGIVVLLFPGQSDIINGFSLGASSVALFGDRKSVV